jgi:hypothetical protein
MGVSRLKTELALSVVRILSQMLFTDHHVVAPVLCTKENQCTTCSYRELKMPMDWQGPYERYYIDPRALEGRMSPKGSALREDMAARVIPSLLYLLLLPNGR